MNIKLRLLEESHTDKLYKFEVENRDFFERILPSRGNEYYDINNFRKIQKELVEEQKDELVYMYLIFDEFENLIGRINLVSVARGDINKAELGYRIAEKYQGKGYGKKAVELILEYAYKVHDLHMIEAGTAIDNIGSQIVLIKNGFEFLDRVKNVVEINGQLKDGINFVNKLR